jgi:hypothetical protein
MNKKTILLTESYDKLGIDFTPINDKHLHINIFPLNHFYYILDTHADKIDYTYKITSGSKVFIYSNLYEIMLWYNYYTHKYIHIQKRYNNHCLNKSLHRQKN